jgi:hypothetical protein
MTDAITASAETLSRNTLFEQLSELNSADRWWVVEKLLSSLKGEPIKLKGKRVKDPSAPKREVKPDSYIHFVNKVVWPILDSLSQTEENPDRKVRMRSVDARTQIGTILWKDIKEREDKAEAFSELSNDQVSEAFNTWFAEAPVKVKKTKSSDKASDASDGSKKSKRSGKLDGMTDDEKAAFYKARGAAAAAARAKNKAAKAEAESVAETSETEETPEPKPEKVKKVKKAKSEPEEPEFGSEQRAWTNPKDGKTYIRMDDLLWDAATAAWVGVYNRKTRTIDTSAPEPEYSDDE